MAGMQTEEHSVQEMRTVYVDNLRYAAEELGKHGITALIEPVNSRISAPGYYMDNVDTGNELKGCLCLCNWRHNISSWLLFQW